MPPSTIKRLSLGFDSGCWDEATKTAVDSGVNDLEKICRLGREKNYAVRVIFIPSPWSIKGENLLGKEFYYLEKSSVLGDRPLFEYMASRLSCPATNLAPVIRKIKNRSASPQKFYFNFDGHWTSYAHREIAHWIASQFYRTEKN